MVDTWQKLKSYGDKFWNFIKEFIKTGFAFFIVATLLLASFGKVPPITEFKDYLSTYYLGILISLVAILAVGVVFDIFVKDEDTEIMLEEVKIIILYSILIMAVIALVYNISQFMLNLFNLADQSENLLLMMSATASIYLTLALIHFNYKTRS